MSASKTRAVSVRAGQTSTSVSTVGVVVVASETGSVGVGTGETSAGVSAGVVVTVVGVLAST